MAKRKRKGRMPPALAAYWAKHPRRRRGRERRRARRVRANPSLKSLVITAQKAGGKLLRYVGRSKFSQGGKPKVFRSRTVANAVMHHLRELFPGPLRGYRMAVVARR